MQNYLKAVDIAIKNKELNGEKILDGVYNITEEGKVLDYSDDNTENDINVEFEGLGLTEGYITLKQGKVIKLDKVKIDNKVAIYFEEKITLFENIYTLVNGREFNKRLKMLANPNLENLTYETSDTIIKSIEFYSNGELPKGYSLNMLNKLTNTYLSDDKSIIGYYDNGQVYVCSKGLISFNTASNAMFFGFSVLNNINFGKLDTSNATSMGNMFTGAKTLTNLDLSVFNTINVTSMANMFNGCKALINLDISNFDTTNVISMSNMFRECSKLTKINVSNFNTKKVQYMGSMFNSCSNLTSLDLSNFDTSAVTDMNNMFAGDGKLSKLNLTNFDTKKVNSMTNMFRGCTNLKPIFVGENWQIPTTSDNMFTYCDTQNEEQLCEPGSTEEWCIVN